jgi:hypothetical protein
VAFHAADSVNHVKENVVEKLKEFSKSTYFRDAATDTVSHGPEIV